MATLTEKTRKLGYSAIAIALALGICASCREAVDAPVKATIIATGETLAYTAPCGCCGGQSGGLPRRATYLRQLAEELHGKAEKPPGAKAATSSAAKKREAADPGGAVAAERGAW